MFDESECLPISALQHLLFCERQCALIHLEGLWAENRLTVEGRHLHEKADGAKAGPRGGGRTESRAQRSLHARLAQSAAADEAAGGLAGEMAVEPAAAGDTASVTIRIVRGLPLRCFRLGLVGKADVVEFLSRKDGPATPFPVEYKRGKPKKDRSDLVQLCAQALCLEEMLSTSVGRGALFYGRTRRRLTVEFDAALRDATEAAAARLHAMIASGITPRAMREKKCDRCSLLSLCLPDATRPNRSAARYLARTIAAASGTEDESQ